MFLPTHYLVIEILLLSSNQEYIEKLTVMFIMQSVVKSPLACSDAHFSCYHSKTAVQQSPISLPV